MIPWAAGLRLGAYELISPLGAGGMGEVWKARDTRLGRMVAIKRLRVEDTERFEREARVIATLNHPNICTVHDIGPDYMVMEYVEGTPLPTLVPEEEAVRLAIQMARALEAAHRKGIIHRDVKPANILVTGEGVVKLLDFGIAKLEYRDQPSGSDSTATLVATQPGVLIGTVTYMSPEQAQGQPVDARSDIFSFGAVLYEMLSGRRAFVGDTPFAIMSAIVRDEPPQLGASVALNDIVKRCLSKKAAQRFQTIAEVKKALEQIPPKPTGQQPSIAVLPFANMSADKENEYFSDGLSEEIINLLARIPGLKVIARTSAFAFKGKQEDIRRIAEALGVATVLEGSVRRAGNRLRVTAQLIAASDGSHLWSERFDREMADVFAIQDEIAGAIARALRVKLAGTQGDHRPYTPPLPAYEAFLKGRHHLTRFRPDWWARAKDWFEQAVALDPAYAQPHAQLGLTYLLMGSGGIRPFREMVPLVRSEARTALEMDPSEPVPHFLLGAVAAANDYDWTEAADEFRAAMAANTATGETHWAYASFCLGPFGRFLESAAEMQLAVEQDPLNVSLRGLLASYLNLAGMHDRAEEEAHKAMEIDENHFLPYYVLGEIYMVTGRLEEAVAMAERAHQAAPWNSMLAGALVRSGEKARAAELIRQMGESPIQIWGRVLYHLLASEVDEAADWYEKMIERREPFAIIYARAPVGKALRESPRWPKLAKMMNLPE